MWVPPAAGRFTSDFGPRNTGIPGASTYHRGVDIAPPKPGQTGRPVVAVHTGVVLAAGWSSVRGYWVVIRHADGTATRSQHMAEAAWVTPGAKVRTGQRVGTIGATGVSNGPHLHFEWVEAGADWTTSTAATDPEPPMLARGVNLRTAVAVTNALWTAAGLPNPAALTLPDDLEADMSWTDTTGTTNPVTGAPATKAESLQIAAHYAYRAWELEIQQRAQITALIGAVAALSGGQVLDEAKLLASITAASKAGVVAGYRQMGQALVGQA